MYQKIRNAIAENKEVFLVAAVVTLTIVVVKTRPRYVIDVMISTGAKELAVDFSDGSTNVYPLHP